MSRPWVLISGASSGFGEASALQLAREGWNLLLTSRREDRLEAVANTCRELGAEVHVAAWDMRERQDTLEGVKELMSRAGIASGQEAARPSQASSTTRDWPSARAPLTKAWTTTGTA